MAGWIWMKFGVGAEYLELHIRLPYPDTYYPAKILVKPQNLKR